MKDLINKYKMPLFLIFFFILLLFFTTVSAEKYEEPKQYPVGEMILDVDYHEEYMSMILAKINEEIEKQKVVTYVPNVISSGIYEVTFYTAGYESTGKQPGDKYYGITASGTRVQEGRTVACPKGMAFGTVLNIEGFGERVCEDRGGAIKGHRLDIYVTSLEEAKRLGRQKLKVEIISGDRYNQ